MAHQSCSNTSLSVHEDHFKPDDKNRQTRSLHPGPLEPSVYPFFQFQGPSFVKPYLPETEMGQGQFYKGWWAAPQEEGKWCLRTTRHCLSSPPTTTPTQGLAGLSLSGQKSSLEALATLGEGGSGEACGEGSREFCVTAGLTMWPLFPLRVASAPLRVVDREEQSWKHLPGPWEKACVLPG